MPIELTPSPSPSDTYSTRENDEQAYGPDNLEVYADLNDNGDASEITDRINYAHSVVYQIINSKITGAGLTAPATDANFSQFDLLAYIESELVGAWLYRTRGKNDLGDDVAGKMQARWDEAMALLDSTISSEGLTSGSGRFAGAGAIAIATNTATIPFVI